MSEVEIKGPMDSAEFAKHMAPVQLKVEGFAGELRKAISAMQSFERAMSKANSTAKKYNMALYKATKKTDSPIIVDIEEDADKMLGDQEGWFWWHEFVEQIGAAQGTERQVLIRHLCSRGWTWSGKRPPYEKDMKNICVRGDYKHPFRDKDKVTFYDATGF